jgi:hypothetical protein
MLSSTFRTWKPYTNYHSSLGTMAMRGKQLIGYKSVRGRLGQAGYIGNSCRMARKSLADSAYSCLLRIKKGHSS